MDVDGFLVRQCHPADADYKMLSRGSGTVKVSDTRGDQAAAT